MVEETVATGRKSSSDTRGSAQRNEPLSLARVDASRENRRSLHLPELDRLLGGMASLTITKTTQPDGSSVTEVTDFTLIPLVTHTANDSSYAVYKLEDYTDELGARNVLVRMTTARLWKRFYEIVGEDKRPES